MEAIEQAFFNHDHNGSEPAPGQWEKRRDQWRSFKVCLAAHPRQEITPERLRHETTLGQGEIDHWAALEAERDEAIAARKSSAADWLSQVEQANTRVRRALQQVALAERERDAARAWSARWKNAAKDWRRICRDLWRRKQDLKQERDATRAKLSEWQTLRLWGAEPQNIHDFIKGQQVRIYETQDMETTCEQLERAHAEARADCERLNRLLRAETALGQGDIDHWAELQRERDEAREALSEIAFYLSVGMGDETTTAEQYKQRIQEGIKMLTDPIVNLWKQAESERDEAREQIKGWELKWKCAVDMAALAQVKLDKEAAK